MSRDTRPLIGVVKGGGMRGPLNAAGAAVVSVYDESDLTYLDQLDGIVLCGGQDVAPSRYGIRKIDWDSSVYTDKQRDDFEFRAVSQAQELGLTIMGVCRGAQLINVAHGGTLHQDIKDLTIDDHWGHILPSYWRKRSLCAKALDSLLMYASHYHHQAVDRIGEGLIPSAWSEEGLVEAFESVSGPYILGTQFHPEMDWNWDDDALRIFEVFVDMTPRRHEGDTHIRLNRFEEMTGPSDDGSTWYKSAWSAKNTVSVFAQQKPYEDDRDILSVDEIERLNCDAEVEAEDAWVYSKTEHEKECDLMCIDGPCWDPRNCNPSMGDCMRAALAWSDDDEMGGEG